MFGKDELVAESLAKDMKPEVGQVIDHPYLSALPYPFPDEQARLSRFKTWQDQDEFFKSKMRSFVELEDNAWTLGGVLQPEGVPVFERNVSAQVVAT